MNKLERIKIKETKEIDYYNIDMSLDEILIEIQQAKDDGWEGIIAKSYYDYCEIYFYKYRLENDKEYEKRMKKFERQNVLKGKLKEERKLMYEKLKKEFEEDS